MASHEDAGAGAWLARFGEEAFRDESMKAFQPCLLHHASASAFVVLPLVFCRCRLLAVGRCRWWWSAAVVALAVGCAPGVLGRGFGLGLACLARRLPGPRPLGLPAWRALLLLPCSAVGLRLGRRRLATGLPARLGPA